jgi:uncharacterized lipoprotein YddW (UPF0748 family)
VRALLLTLASLAAIMLPACATSWEPAPAVGLPEVREELRGVWIATVDNIDWPSRPGLSEADQKREALAILDRADQVGLNAIFLQVRPTCDSMYESSLEPWSAFLTGQSGRSPGYDPLAFWIDGAHARGMQLHAWVNPYRARHPKSIGTDAPSHVSRTMPDAVATYGDYLWLDPGNARARAHTLGVVEDILKRYDVDGLTLDDYFYPYPIKGKAFPDQASYGAYTRAGGRLALADWRRENTAAMVQDLHTLVQRVRPGAWFSISPFGIWRPGNPAPVKGFDAYEGLFADSRAWLREGRVDALHPQLYWKIDAPQQPFGALLDWWRSQRASGAALWVALYASRTDPAGDNWGAGEILRQIELARSRGDVGGHVLFSMKAIMNDWAGLSGVLEHNAYPQAATPPPCPRARSLNPAPSRLEGRSSGGALDASWGPAEHVSRWVVYERRGGAWTSRLSGRTAEEIPLRNDRGRLEALGIAAVDGAGRVWPARVIEPAR